MSAGGVERGAAPHDGSVDGSVDRSVDRAGPGGRAGGFLGRLRVYAAERQPIPSGLFYPAAYSAGVYCVFSAISGTDTLPPPSLWYAYVTAVLFNACFWLNDDIKDEAFDRVHNPRRAAVRGAITYADLKAASLSCFAIMTALNIGRGSVTDVFVVWIVLLALWIQSFCFPEEMEGNFPLSISTGGHPMLILGNLYFYEAFLSVSPGAGASAPLVLGICVLFALPTFAWEIARKTRAPEQETAFPSYSKRWGVRRATWVSITYYALTTSGFVAIGLFFRFSPLFVLLEGALGLATLALFFRFMARPTAERNVLKPASEVYDAACKLIVIAEIVRRAF